MKRGFFLLCVLLASAFDARSQWTQTSASLVNPSIGFGGSITHKAGKVWAGTTQLFLSLDSGSTWNAVTSLNLGGEVIVSIDFFDANHGLVVTYAGGAYQTTNGGTTWAHTLTVGSCLSGAFGATKDIVVVVGRLGFAGHIYVSNNGGASFVDNIVEAGGGAYHVATHPSGRICVLARNVVPTRASFIYTSIDNGITWVRGNLRVDLDTYSFTFGGCFTNYIFLINEAYNEPGDTRSEIFRADLAGNNSALVLTDAVAQFTGCGAYFGKSIFIQKASTGGGLLRSTNDGLNWTSIGGPHALWDSRMICAINENVILAIALNGSLWRTVNAGGFPVTGDVSQFTYATPNPVKLALCDSGTIRAIFQISATCSNQKLHVTSQTFSGPNAQFFSIFSQKPPFVVEGNASTTIAATFGGPTDTGTYSSLLRLQGFFRDANGMEIPFDTTIYFEARLTPAAPEFTADRSTVQFRPLSPCDNTADTTITLTNTGCDTLLITGPGPLKPGFTMNTTFPLQLPPGDSVKVTFSFAPTAQGNHTMNGVFVGESNGLSKSVYISLSGSFQGAAPELAAQDSAIMFRSLTACDPPIDTTIMVTNVGCDTIIIVSGPGSLTPGFTIDAIEFPVVIPPGQSIPIRVHFDAPDTGEYRTNVAYTIDYHGSLSTFRLVLNGNGAPVAPQLLADVSDIEFGTISTCDGRQDTTIVFRNTGCDTLTIISGPGVLPAEFSWQNVAFPIVLPPDSSIVLHFSFYPSGDGSFTAVPRFVCENDGLRDSIPVSLNGIGSEGKGVLSVRPLSYHFPTLPICRTDSLLGQMVNTGCDTLIIDEALFSGDRDFFVSLTLPITLAPGDTLPYWIYLHPTTKGGRRSQAAIIAHTAHGSRSGDTATLTIDGIVTDGARTLSASSDTLDFGTVTLCDTQDSVIVLRNDGCDTLVVTAADFQGTGFIMTVQLPIVIPPGASKDIAVRTVIDTTDGVFGNTGSILITSNADNQLLPILLTRSYRYPKHYKVELRENEVIAAEGENVRFDLVISDDPQGITAIDLDLNYNEDLLGFDAVSGPNMITFADGHIRVSGNPIISNNGVIGSLHFKVFLTKDSTTPLTLSNLHFNNGDLYFERCMSTTELGGAGFTYHFRCGERLLGKYLGGVQIFSITSLRPNPGRDEVELTLVAEQDADLRIMIYDALGKKHRIEARRIAKGTEQLLVDVSSLPSGIYYVEVRSGSTSSNISFVKAD